jgi:hypothetical protein
MLADDPGLVLHREALAPVSSPEARADDLRTPLQTALLVREQRSVSAMPARCSPRRVERPSPWCACSRMKVASA